ncbi:hypothetical protein ISCGN_010374 [Ixodes scapularis]
MDGGNTPVEQVLRPAAANPRFSDCPPEHTDKIAESLAHNRSFMQRMVVDRRRPFIRQIRDLAHDELVVGCTAWIREYTSTKPNPCRCEGSDRAPCCSPTCASACWCSASKVKEVHGRWKHTSGAGPESSHC